MTETFAQRIFLAPVPDGDRGFFNRRCRTQSQTRPPMRRQRRPGGRASPPRKYRGLPRISKARLEEMIGQATVDAYNESALAAPPLKKNRAEIKFHRVCSLDAVSEYQRAGRVYEGQRHAGSGSLSDLLPFRRPTGR